MKKTSKKKLVLDKTIIAKLTDQDSLGLKGGGWITKKCGISPICTTSDLCDVE